MFSGFFHYDNPVWRFLGKFCDVLILNILWTICSLPIITVGASTTAVYYVTLKLVRDEEGPTVRSFFRSFKENFKQATIIWLILLVIGCLIGFDLYFFVSIYKEPSKFRTVMMAVFIAMAAIHCLVTLFVFPLQAKFYNPVKRTLFNAFFIGMRHFLPGLGMLALDFGLSLIGVYIIPLLQPVLILFGFPLVAFFNSYVLVYIFDKYMPSEEEGKEDEAAPQES